MPDEIFISYFAYYTASFLWGLFFRRFWMCVVVLGVVWHYWFYGLIVGSALADDLQFRYALPGTVVLGVFIGYQLSTRLNLRRLLFWTEFDKYGWWIPTALIEFAMFHSVLVVWETTGAFVPPFNYVVTFVIYLVMLPLWYFFTYGSTVWAHWDDSIGEHGGFAYKDRAAVKFHAYFALYLLSSSLVFVVVEWANPRVWPFWIMLGVFAFHLVLLLLISSFIVNDVAEAQYKRLRREAVRHMEEHVPFFRRLFASPWTSVVLPDVEMQLLDASPAPEAPPPMPRPKRPHRHAHRPGAPPRKHSQKKKPAQIINV